MNNSSNLDHLSDIIAKLGKQATDSLVGQIVLIELLEEKGIITKEEYRSRVGMRNNDIRRKIEEYFNSND